MSSRSLRRSVAVVAFAAFLLPGSTLFAAQRQSHAAPTSAAQHRSLLEMVVGFFLDWTIVADGNG
jgi:hypothetical protein